MTEGKSGTVANEGAELAYDWEGSGPLLLTISGGGGDAPRHIGLTKELADAYTVVRYDRRCNSRSTGDAGADLDMAQQARDALAIVLALGEERAFVFGNSGGASIALKLAEDYPEAVRGMALHEPPVLAILPERDELIAFMDKVESTFHTAGMGPAMGLFASSLVGFEAPAPNAGQRIGEQNSDVNLAFFLGREVHTLCRYDPDLAKIRAAGVPALLLRGAASGEAYYARTASILAEALGGEVKTVPGNHVAFIFQPEPIAALLRENFGAIQRAA